MPETPARGRRFCTLDIGTKVRLQCGCVVAPSGPRNDQAIGFSHVPVHVYSSCGGSNRWQLGIPRKHQTRYCFVDNKPSGPDVGSFIWVKEIDPLATLLGECGWSAYGNT